MKYAWLGYLIISIGTLHSTNMQPVIEEETLDEVEHTLDESEKTHHCPNPNCPHHQKEDDTQRQDDRQLQQLAVNTLANMAQGILAIGWDPNNPTAVANNVTHIVGTFANFIAHAINSKTIDMYKLFNDAEFINACKHVLITHANYIR